MRSVLALLAATFAAIVTANAASACSGRLSGAANVDATYAPFQALDASKEFSLTVQNTGETECIFWLGVERLAPGAEAAALNFDLRGRDGAWSSSGGTSLTGPTWLASRRLAPNESYDFALILAIPAGQMLPPGDYINTFEAKLHAAPEARPPETAEQFQPRTLRLSVAVTAHLSINIAGAGVRKTIDFGELAEGARRQVRIETRSNQRFQLDVLSRNGGVLAMAPPYEGSRVPYAVALDGKTLKLPDTVGPFAGTGLAGSQFDIEFTIGDILNKRAGLYRDEVTIEIRPVI
jgi:hypothetical protein